MPGHEIENKDNQEEGRQENGEKRRRKRGGVMEFPKRKRKTKRTPINEGDQEREVGEECAGNATPEKGAIEEAKEEAAAVVVEELL